MMHKGADPKQIIDFLRNHRNEGSYKSPKIRSIVEADYNEYFGNFSKYTKCSNMAEWAVMQQHEGDINLRRLPQDRNYLDLLTWPKNVDKDKKLLITVVQQKGNDASTNTSFREVMKRISKKIKKGVEKYFHLMENDNPLITGQPYKVKGLIGYLLAYPDGKDVARSSKHKNIDILAGQDYLDALGLQGIDKVDLSFLIMDQPAIVNHEYDAVGKCPDWDDVYEKCVQELINRERVKKKKVA